MVNPATWSPRHRDDRASGVHAQRNQGSLSTTFLQPLVIAHRRGALHQRAGGTPAAAVAARPGPPTGQGQAEGPTANQASKRAMVEERLRLVDAIVPGRFQPGMVQKCAGGPGNHSRQGEQTQVHDQDRVTRLRHQTEARRLADASAAIRIRDKAPATGRARSGKRGQRQRAERAGIIATCALAFAEDDIPPVHVGSQRYCKVPRVFRQ